MFQNAQNFSHFADEVLVFVNRQIGVGELKKLPVFACCDAAVNGLDRIASLMIENYLFGMKNMFLGFFERQSEVFTKFDAVCVEYNSYDHEIRFLYNFCPKSIFIYNC